MMYRPYNQPIEDARRKSRRGGRRALPVWLLLPVVASAFYVFVWARKADVEAQVERVLQADDVPVAEMNDGDGVERVFRRRLLRNTIPACDIYKVGYRAMFNDSNYVQLSAARANGIEPSRIDDPAKERNLVPIFSTRYYKVDSMYHSRPYLVPEAVLLLDYIAHRYSEVMAERFPKMDQSRVIVTSALRTEQSERRLRRVNRNATDTSCHIYGTTFDLSAQRYEHVASGRDTVVEAYKVALAQALYELRYEGLCYVKYERGSCFHITLRTTQYEGREESEMRSYVNPGSPDYLLTKAPPRPSYSAAPKAQQPQNTRNTKLKKNSDKRKSEKANRKFKAAQPKRAGSKQENVAKPAVSGHAITERERLSLEQFERNY